MNVVCNRCSGMVFVLNFFYSKKKTRFCPCLVQLGVSQKSVVLIAGFSLLAGSQDPTCGSFFKSLRRDVVQMQMIVFTKLQLGSW